MQHFNYEEKQLWKKKATKVQDKFESFMSEIAFIKMANFKAVEIQQLIIHALYHKQGHNWKYNVFQAFVWILWSSLLWSEAFKCCKAGANTERGLCPGHLLENFGYRHSQTEKQVYREEKTSTSEI